MTGPREVIEAYWQAEERRDLDGVLDHYAEDAELVVPEMGRLVGHSEIRKFYEESIENFPELRVDIVRGIVNGPRVPSSGRRCIGIGPARSIPVRV
jgi:ketosteroid isomerase-like protein